MDNEFGPIDVLLIDDDFDMRAVLSDLLSIEGYSVDAAADGNEALQHLGTHGLPRVILLDLKMPNLGGEDFLEIRRKYLRWANIPVVVMTGRQSPPSLVELGVREVLPKPPDLTRLLQLLSQLCPSRDTIPS